MKMKKRILPALLAAALAGASAGVADAAQFSNVVVFGDSLSDAGYYRPFLAALGLPPQVVATLGRFTTNPGPVWSELVSQFYGVTPGASNAGGFIFAQGGARVAQDSASTPPGSAQRPVSTQVNEYLAASGGKADPNALYAVWIGANDIFQNLALLQAGAIDQNTLQNNVLGAAGAEVAQIGRLRAAGARYVMVFGLPDIGGTLAFAGSPANAAAVTQLSAGYNTTLFSGLAEAGIQAIPVDTFSLLTEVLANHAAYGLTNVTSMACGPFPPITTPSTISAQFCGPTNLVAPNADQTYLFADAIHPTTAAQAIIAQFAESLIEGPTQYSLLAETPLRARASHVQTLNDGLLMGGAEPVGRFKAFASADGANFDIASGTGNSGMDSNHSAVSVGVTVRVSEIFALGAAFGQDRANASFGDNAGGFNTREDVYSLFGAVHWSGFYGTGVFSIGNINYHGIQRNIALGPLVRTASATTDGANGSAFLSAGYDFRLGDLSIGPTVAVTSQDVTVNAFDEAGAGSADLHIAQQTRRSEICSGGIRASYALGRWTPWLRVTADREQKDDPRFVTASPLSIPTGNSYSIPAYMPDTSFVTTALGLNGHLGDQLAVSLTYYNVSGRSGIKEDGFGGTVSYRF
ncbi:MAG TPA: autotransporter domain-containing protein [Usitatibacter sp.]|nr:autotransporter domain-containing protein [Usitatibacter sp.]